MIPARIERGRLAFLLGDAVERGDEDLAAVIRRLIYLEETVGDWAPDPSDVFTSIELDGCSPRPAVEFVPDAYPGMVRLVPRRSPVIDDEIERELERAGLGK